MKYTFKITEDKAETKEVPAMSFKKALKSLITANPKWNGIIEYVNKKERGIRHVIKEGKRESHNYIS